MKVKLQDLSKKFGQNYAVKNLNLSIEESKTIGLLGPNGCGKTTTIGMILGLILPSTGKILIDNQNIFNFERTKFLKEMNFGIVREAVQAMSLDNSKANSGISSQSFFGDVTQQFHQRPLMQTISQPQKLAADLCHLGAMEVLNIQLPDERVFNRQGYLTSTLLHMHTAALHS